MARTPEALVGATTCEVSHTPAEWLKPNAERLAEGRGEADIDCTPVAGLWRRVSSHQDPEAPGGTAQARLTEPMPRVPGSR